MQSQHCRVTSFEDGILAPASAIACAKAKAKVSLALMSNAGPLAQPDRSELLAWIDAEASKVARQGDIAEQPVVDAVVAALPLWPGAGQAGLEEARAWAHQTALVVAGDRIAHQHALKVARRNHGLERAGTSPEDVAQHVSKRWFESPATRYQTVFAIQAWAGKVAMNFIIDQARRLQYRRRLEDNPDVAAALHDHAPRSVQEMAAEYLDVHRQAAIIAAHLGKPDSKIVRQFWIEVEASMVGIYPVDAALLAEILETTPDTIYQNRRRIRRVVKELYEAGEIDLPVGLRKRGRGGAQ